MTDGQPELFQMAMVGDREVVRGPSLPEPPTGPRKAPPRKAANTREAYWAWRKTEDGRVVWEYIQRCALEAMARGVGRISSKALVEVARSMLHLKTNNSHTRYIAEELIERHPPLIHLIERRKCQKP